MDSLNLLCRKYVVYTTGAALVAVVWPVWHRPEGHGPALSSLQALLSWDLTSAATGPAELGSRGSAGPMSVTRASLGCVDLTLPGWLSVVPLGAPSRGKDYSRATMWRQEVLLDWRARG